MNTRAIAAEVAALVAVTLWVYAGTAVAVAQIGDGVSASMGAAAAVVFLSYGLVRLLQRLDFEEQTLRLWGAGLSVGLLYLILRIEVAGEPYLWELGWLGDLLSDPGGTLEGRAGEVTVVVLLGAVWLRGVLRGARDLTFEGLLAEVSVGLVVVLLAAALAPAVDAPGAVAWLPVPYMVVGLLALALAHLRPVVADRRRPFLGAWAIWTGGSLGAIAGLALLAASLDLSWFGAVADGLALAARSVAVAVEFVLSPLILALGWTAERLIDWLVRGDEFTLEPPDGGELTRQLKERDAEPSRWSEVLGYVVRSGLVALAVAVALTALWFAFGRLRRRREDEVEVREQVEMEAGGPLSDLRAILSGALGRLRGRPGDLRGRDAIGRLYGSVLRRAAAQGVPRPPSATPLEFAPRLEAHFGSAVPAAISRAYAEARYGRRPPARAELERLRAGWDEVARGSA